MKERVFSWRNAAAGAGALAASLCAIETTYAQRAPTPRTSEWNFSYDRATNTCFASKDFDGSLPLGIPGDAVIDIIYQVDIPSRFEERESGDGAHYLWPVPVAIYTPIVARSSSGYVTSGHQVSPTALNDPWYTFELRTAYQGRPGAARPPARINARRSQAMYFQNRNSRECFPQTLIAKLEYPKVSRTVS
jgi:hypothetical protein